MDEQMIELIAKALHQSEAELFGYVRRPFELEGLWRNNERRYLREARAAHSVMAGKVAELEADRDELRAERDALLQRPIDLAKMDSIDEDATDRMVAYYWWQQAQDARAALAPHPKGME